MKIIIFLLIHVVELKLRTQVTVLITVKKDWNEQMVSKVILAAAEN